MTSRHSSGDLVVLPGAREDDTIDYDTTSEAGSTPIERPTKIGRYIVLDLLGVGGMGVVCTAYDPKLDRKVALKLLRDRRGKGAMTTSGQARLIREAQALAKLSHPNIITVHDVDTFDDKLYMAMEYVEGQSLRQWLEAQYRPWREVVDVFVHAARGLAAAHAAGITHRDFKPGNVQLGDDGRVRVLDFGLAKATDEPDPELSEDSADLDPRQIKTGPLDKRDSAVMDVIGSTSDLKLTAAGRAVGTPAYMAPEQHLGVAVSPKTDQFSFAVALYEGLYGVLPFRGDCVEDGFWNATEGIIAELPKDAPVIPAWVHRVLLRMLKPRPEERYPSMDVVIAALLADPAKRRRRWALGGTAVALSGLGGFGVVMALQPDESRCQGAEARLAGAWDSARQREVETAFLATEATYASDTWERVDKTLGDYADAWVDLHTDVCEATHVRGEQSEVLLDVRMQCLDRRLSALSALGQVLTEADAKVVEKAVSAAGALPPTEPCRTLKQPPELHRLPEDPNARAEIERVGQELDRVQALMDAGKYADAIELAQPASAKADGLEHAPTQARGLLLLGEAYGLVGTSNLAEASFRRAIETAAEGRLDELEASAWIDLIHEVGTVQRRHETGLAWVLSADAAARRADSDGHRVKLLNERAAVDFGRGEYESARTNWQQTVELAQSVHGPNHPLTIRILTNLGSVLVRLERNDEAKNYLERAVEGAKQRFGAEHPSVAGYELNLGNVLMQLGQIDDAKRAYARALESRERTLPPNHRLLGNAHNALGVAHRRAGDLEDAAVHLRRALEIQTEALETDHPLLIGINNNLGKVAIEQTRLDDALAHFERAHAIASLKLPESHPAMARTEHNLCGALAQMGRLAEAETRCRRARAILEADPAQHGKDLGHTLAQLSRIRLGRGAAAEAERLAARAVELLAPIGVEHEVWGARLALAQAIWAAPQRRGEAVAIVRQARDALVDADPDTAGARDAANAWIRDHRVGGR